MKTSLSAICVFTFLLTSCGDRAQNPGPKPGDDDLPHARDGMVPLTTDLPREMVCGTIRSIHLPIRTSD